MVLVVLFSRKIFDYSFCIEQSYVLKGINYNTRRRSLVDVVEKGVLEDKTRGFKTHNNMKKQPF